VSTGNIITFENMGDIDLGPEILIKRTTAGAVTMKNLSRDGKYFTVSNFANNETVYIDLENKFIQSDMPAIYKNNDFSGEFFLMKRGLNRLEITGDCIVKFRYKFKTLQG
jgi:phage-related protein